MTLPREFTLSVGVTTYVCRREPDGLEPPGVVTAYSQNNSRWRDLVYAGGMTFHKAGCLVVAVAMIASLVCEDLEPPEVARRLREAGAFEGGYLSHPARIPLALPRLSWGGVEHWRDGPADVDSLSREIRRYGATICELKWNPLGPPPYKSNQHFLVVEGCDGVDADVVDPWNGLRIKLSETSYRLKNWDVARTLTGMRMLRPVT